jgi:hypothetical protein
MPDASGKLSEQEKQAIQEKSKSFGWGVPKTVRSVVAIVG